METPFGYMLTSNITPDLETGIGSWSADEFYRAMHHGVNRHGQDMFPTMPYDFYTKVTRDDVDAIFAYLKTVKPAKNAVDVNHLHFPFSLRKTMAVWRELFFSEGPFKPDPTMSAAWNRGAYLVEGLGHCSDCHSPRNLLGGIEKGKDFTGGTIDGWFAMDITADISTGLGSWAVDEIAAYLKTGAAKGKTTVFGPMVEVIQIARARHSRRLCAARRQHRCRRAGPRRYLQDRVGWNPCAGRERANAGIREPAEGSGHRRHRKLHSDELGQRRAGERHRGRGGRTACDNADS
jgi:mono/diheme cytochrome c family protein